MLIKGKNLIREEWQLKFGEGMTELEIYNFIATDETLYSGK